MRNVTQKFAMAVAGVVMTATTASAQILNFGGSAVFRDQPNSGGANLFIDFLQGATEPTTANTTGGIVSAVPTTTFPGVVTSPVATTGQIQDLIVGAGGVLGTSTGAGVSAGGRGAPGRSNSSRPRSSAKVSSSGRSRSNAAASPPPPIHVSASRTEAGPKAAR